jgi:hypothetical protein
MSNKFFNFYFDPVLQGYDTSAWRTLLGVPTIVSSQLQITPTAKIIHYANILRCDAVFSVTIPAPTSGDNRRFGLVQYSKNEYIYFKITDTVLTAECSNGVTSSATAITWQTAWTNTATEFRIKWEAGAAKFYVAGNLETTLSERLLAVRSFQIYQVIR